MNRYFKKEHWWLILSGIAMGLSFPPMPFPFQLLMFLGLIPLFLIIEKKEKLIEINRAAYIAFFVFNLLTLYWVGSWQKEADPFLMISGVLLVFVNPVFFLIPTTLYYFSRKVLSERIALFLLPIFWVTYEYVYMLTDASFPWLTLGNGLSYFHLFIQAADIIGALGLSITVLYINVLLTRSFQNKENKKLIFRYSSLAALIMILFLGYGVYRISTFKLSDKKIKVGLIQPNLDPWDKWNGSSLNSLLDQYFALSKISLNKGADLLVWPETAIPVYLFAGEYGKTVDSIYSFLITNRTSLLTGVPWLNYYYKGDRMPPDVKFSKNGDFYYSTYNAVVLMNPENRNVPYYGKAKLVPFGERVPFVDQFPFLGDWIKWGVGLSGWNVGRDTTVFNFYSNKLKDTVRINAMVCYESIYPYYITAFINKGADLITVVTNDSWYGNSSGPYQHKEISVLRAVENRKSVIRSANGGISCIIDPLGRTSAETQMFVKAQLTGDVIIQPGKTFFTEHSLIIPLLCSAFSLWVAGMFLLMKMKQRFKL